MSRSGAHLRLLERAAEAVNRSTTIEEAALQVLPDVCAHTGWQAGRLYLPRHPGDDVLLPTPGELGVEAVHGFPVLLGDEVVAVLGFSALDAAPPDQDHVDLIASVGHLLARVVERGRAAAALRRSEQRYWALAHSVHDAVVAADAAGRITAFNPAAERIFGRTAGDVVGCPLSLLIPGLSLSGAPGEPMAVPGVRRNGAEIPLEVTLSDWDGTGGRVLTGVVRDMSALRDQLHDPLTGLANRLLLQDRLEHALVHSRRRGSSVAVLAVDLDRFKMINDSYGPHAGDALLVAVASRLQAVVRSSDTVGRVGGDEFAIICEEVADETEAMTLVSLILEAFTGPFPVEGHDLAISPTVGVAVAPATGADAGQILRDAELARERARQRGQGQTALYDESMRADASQRLSVEHDLRAAIHDGQLRLHYQPIVDLDRRSVAGVEALVRWEHPTRGLLLPQDFIGLAEDSGLIVPLGRWVLEQACQQGAAWQDGLAAGIGEGVGDGISAGMRVSVNVSARQFRQDNWADDVARVLSASGFEPGQLVLEITESVLMEDTDTTSVRLAQLRKLGVRIAIDDFGTGYSSLGYLRQFPVDILKVDKSFIDGVAQGPHESALARAVIKLAATLHIDAVAEGVTSHRQYAQLRRLRCRFGQGYFFSPPAPAARVGAILARAALALD